MSNFDERSGIVPCPASWGHWYQTMEEVFLEIKVSEGTLAKEIKCTIKPKHIKVVIKGETILEGTLYEPVQADEAVWTFEDKKLLRICLPKAYTTADHCWKSLIQGQYEANPWTFDQMEKKLTLERFQKENPGFDFSGADLSGNYHGNGPQLPS
ncbi:hypothetical protein ACJMK2_032855 [Sinanodonta woodiana]|uniref:CS domain-containing protein n=1 Tax=Sinanodonta woodiana TaxID=1069815 RepID=A0ABD3X4Y2_SINWO